MTTTMLTWADILAEVKRCAKEPSSGTGQWSDSQYLRRANMIMHMIEAETNCLETLTTSSSTAVTQEYTYPLTALVITEVRYLKKPLYKVTLKKLQAESRVGTIINPWTAWCDDNVKYWYLRANKVGLVPYPKIASNNGIEILSRCMSGDITTGTDYPFDSVTYMIPYVSLIIWGIVNWVFNELGEDVDSSKKAYYETKYQQLYVSLKLMVKDRLGEIPTPDIEKNEAPSVGA